MIDESNIEMLLKELKPGTLSYALVEKYLGTMTTDRGRELAAFLQEIIRTKMSEQGDNGKD